MQKVIFKCPQQLMKVNLALAIFNSNVKKIRSFVSCGWASERVSSGTTAGRFNFSTLKFSFCYLESELRRRETFALGEKESLTKVARKMRKLYIHIDVLWAHEEDPQMSFFKEKDCFIKMLFQFVKNENENDILICFSFSFSMNFDAREASALINES